MRPNTKPWSIRRATPADVVSYSAAAERFFRQTYGHDPDHAKVMDQHCADTYSAAVISRQLANGAVTALIAEVAGAIVALAQMRVDGDGGEVQRFYVDRIWHGQGLAQALMDAVEAQARALRLRSLHLGVWTANDRAIAFYRRRGFITVGTVEFTLAGALQADALMRRDFSDATEV